MFCLFILKIMENEINSSVFTANTNILVLCVVFYHSGLRLDIRVFATVCVTGAGVSSNLLDETKFLPNLIPVKIEVGMW